MDQKTVDILCGICYAQHITKSADDWCLDCEDGMCLACQLYHSSSNATRNHQIISVESYKKIPTFITDVAVNCKEHDEKYTLYCPNHDAVCCPGCITSDHSKCINLQAVSELQKNAKASALLSSFEQRLQEMKSFVDKVFQALRLNQSTIEEQRVTVINQIKEVRSKINLHLDSLEESFVQKFNEMTKETHSKLAKLEAQLGLEILKVKDLEEDFQAMKKYGSDIQVFYGSRKFDSAIEKEERRLESVSETKNIYEKTIQCKIGDHLPHILSKLIAFGSISIETGAPFGNFTSGKNAQVLSMSTAHQLSSTLNDIKKLTLQSNFLITVEKNPSNIKACLISPNSKILFADYENLRVIILNKDKTIHKLIKVSSKPNDVTLIDDAIVALSTDDGIKIIDINSEAVIQDIKASKPCHGISYHDGSLYWCQKSKGIQKVLLSSGEISTLVPQPSLSDFSYITIHKDKIYQTGAEVVTCFSIQGHTEWEFKDGSTQDDTRRVTVDNDSYVYVTSCQGNSVIMISPDGKRSIKILGDGDNLSNPTGIFYDKLQSNLFVTNLDGVAFIYHVS